jgi:hypothetical protein
MEPAISARIALRIAFVRTFDRESDVHTFSRIGGGQPERNDQSVRIVWRLDGEAVVGP